MAWKRKGNEIKELAAKGKTRQEIAAALNLSLSTVAYHLDDGTRQKQLEASRKRHSTWHKTEKGREWFRNYMKNRYHTDEQFREKVIKCVMAGQRKKVQAVAETNKRLLEKIIKRNNGKLSVGDMWIKVKGRMSRTMFNRFLNEFIAQRIVTERNRGENMKIPKLPQDYPADENNEEAFFEDDEE
jgi:DNA-binding CsgD family transcriptional regulator